MKTLTILTLMLSLSFLALAKENPQTQSDEVEVTVKTDGDKVVKTVKVNGKELNEEEIKAFEAAGKMKVIHLDKDKSIADKVKVIVIDDDTEKAGNKSAKVTVTTQGDSWNDDNGDEVRVVVNSDGKNTTKQVIVNGKELSPEEIKDFEDSGRMKVIHLNKEIKGLESYKTIFINDANHSNGDESSMEIIVDPLSGDEQFWKSDNGKHVKIITHGFSDASKNSGTSLGFITMQQDDGLHIGFLLEGSDAKQSGLQSGDLIKRINDIDFTSDKDNYLKNMAKLRGFKEGEVVNVEVQREGKTLSYEVTAKKRDVAKLLKNPPKEFFNWLETSKDSGENINKELKVLVFNGDDKDFKLNTDDINIVFPEKLGDMNFFISDGSSTSQLLGKNHEMSTLSKGLGKYFGTKNGVLILHVDPSNAFALEDGDVIKSIDGKQVNTPKDVIQQLLMADNQSDIKIKVIRHKRNKTLRKL